MEHAHEPSPPERDPEFSLAQQQIAFMFDMNEKSPDGTTSVHPIVAQLLDDLVLSPGNFQMTTTERESNDASYTYDEVEMRASYSFSDESVLEAVYKYHIVKGSGALELPMVTFYTDSPDSAKRSDIFYWLIDKGVRRTVSRYVDMELEHIKEIYTTYDQAEAIAETLDPMLLAYLQELLERERQMLWDGKDPNDDVEIKHAYATHEYYRLSTEGRRRNFEQQRLDTLTEFKRGVWIEREEAEQLADLVRRLRGA